MVATFRLATTEPDSRILFYYFTLSLLCVLPFGVDDFGSIRWQDWLAVVYIGVSIYFTLALYTRAYAIAPASAIAPADHLATFDADRHIVNDTPRLVALADVAGAQQTCGDGA